MLPGGTEVRLSRLVGLPLVALVAACSPEVESIKLDEETFNAIFSQDPDQYFSELCAEGYDGVKPDMFGLATCENAEWLLSAVKGSPKEPGSDGMASCIANFRTTSGLDHSLVGTHGIRYCVSGEMERRDEQMFGNDDES